MNERLDPRLQEWFTAGRRELDGADFTRRVMSRSRFLGYRTQAALAGLALALVACAWALELPLQDFARLTVTALTTPLVHLPDGWLAWLTLPINTVGSALVLGWRVLRTVRRKMLGL